MTDLNSRTDTNGADGAAKARDGSGARAKADVSTGEANALPVVRMSVRGVVETTLHESDLLPASGAARRMREGAIAHRARQSGRKDADASYRAEAALSCDYQTQALCLRVTGRADGIFLREDGLTVIEEIKLGEADSALVPAHMAQAAMYGHMLSQSEGLMRVGLRVLYVGAAGQPLRAYEEEWEAQTLAREFAELCAPAAAWEAEKLARRRARDASLASLPFPYPTYRTGQRRFAGNVYVAIRERKRLFAQAPTGVGKTAAALYPALRALGDGLCSRVLFLTARTTGRLAALDALTRLSTCGAQVMSVELAAKDKVCPRPERDCRPDVCPLASGFFDRLPDALTEALRGEDGMFSAVAVARLAQRHSLCPFEFALALANLADVVVCDCNYVFDPFVAVDALLPGAALLVDEAHQLPARVRDAHSAAIGVDELTILRRDAGKAHGRTSPLYRALTPAIRALKDAAQEPAFDSGRLDAPPSALLTAMEHVLDAASEQMGRGASPCALNAFSLALSFGFAAGRFDERYAALTDGGERHARITLLCLDASSEILALTKRARGTAFFSATLAPFDAARRTLGNEEGDACLALPSPFDPAQLNARVEPIDLRYAAREANAPLVAEAIARHLGEHDGHAIVFFPSYAFRDRVLNQPPFVFSDSRVESPGMANETGCRPSVDTCACAALANTLILREERGMDEDGRRALLGAFAQPTGEGAPRAALFAVLGGAFSEGVDLPGERLKNVIVVSTGLPQPDERVRAMQAYYDARGEDGFFLCMTLPGMVRVIQAAGRLIRTEHDTGSLLLIDARYRRARERSLLGGTLIGRALDENRV